MSAAKIRFSSAWPPLAGRGVQLDELAASWLVRRNAGLTPEEEEEFRRWLSSDPSHAEAFTRHETTWDELNCPRLSGQASALGLELDRRRLLRRRRSRAYAFTGFGLAAAAALTIIFVLRPPRSPESVLSTTISLCPNQQELSDGSIVELNSEGEIAVSYSPEGRSVQLLKGEALFRVARNPARPFVVIAGDLQVAAVGTAFAVRNTPAEVGLLVTEGRIAVSRVPVSRAQAEPLALQSPIVLTAGYTVNFPARTAAAPPRPRKLTSSEIETALAWRRMRVEIHGTPLDDAVAFLNRENAIQLIVVDPSIRRLRLTGICWSNDPEGFVRLLETGMDVQAERSGGSILLSARP